MKARLYTYLSGLIGFFCLQFAFAAPPQISIVNPAQINVGQSYSLQITASDPEGGVLIYSLSFAPAGMSINSTGLVSWDPTSADAGNHTFGVRVDDEEYLAAQTFVQLTVTDPNNQFPVINQEPLTETDIGSTYTYDLQAMDGDNDSLVYSVWSYPSASGLSISNEGVLTWTPLTRDEVGNYWIAIGVDDGRLGTASRQYNLTVSDPNNNLPVAGQQPILVAYAGQPYTYDPQATDADGDTLTYSFMTWPQDTGIQMSSDGVIAWTPTREHVGDHWIGLTIDDGHLGELRLNLGLKVTDPNNQSPVFASTPSLDATIGTSYQYILDVSDADGDDITLNLFHYPTGMVLDASTNTLTWTPDEAYPWGAQVRIFATDNYGGSTEQQFILNVDETGSGDVDSDGDGVNDNQDTYPDDPTRSVLAAVENLQAVFDGAANINLSWTAIADTNNLGHYVIFRNIYGQPEMILTTVLASETAYVDSDVTNGSAYEYSIKAVDNQNISGDEGVAAQFFVAYNNEAVVDFQAQRVDEPVQLNWSENSGLPAAIRYQILRAVSDQAATVLSEVSVNNFSDSTALWNNDYVYQLRILADFTNPFTSIIVTVPGPLSASVQVNAIPPLTLSFDQARLITGNNWELWVDASDPVSVNASVLEALGPLSIQAQSGANTITSTTDNGQFRLALPKAQGNSWVITVSETTISNRSIISTLSFVSDANAPVVTITPPSTSSSSDDTLVITGFVTDDNNFVAAITAQSSAFAGQTFAVSTGQGGSFTSELPLMFGINLLTITAIDGSGNTGSAQLSVTRLSPLLPEINIQSPSNGVVLSQATVDVSGLVYSSQPPADIRIEMGGQIQFAQAGSETGVYAFSFNDHPLNQGQNTLLVEVKSPEGNTQQSIVLTNNPDADLEEGSAPVITIDPGLIGSTINYDIVTVKGIVTSPVGITGISVDFIAASLSGGNEGEFSFSRQVDISAIPGNQIDLAITATDSSGQTSTEILSLYRDNTAPVITISTANINPPPAINDVVDVPFSLQGEIVDAQLSSFSINGQTVGLVPGELDGTYLFSARINLPVGLDQTLTLVATDRAGNSTSEDIIVNSSSPIVIEMIEPTAGQEFVVVSSESVEVVARINGLSATDVVNLRFAAEPVQVMTLDGNIATHNILINSADSGEKIITIEVLNDLSEVIARQETSIQIIDADTIPLDILKTQPDNEGINSSVGEFIALFFNRPIDPAQLTIEVRETVHGKTWDLSLYANNDILQGGATTALVEAHRDQELIPGTLSVYPGLTSVSYHLSRELAYNADVFVVVDYAGERIEDFTFKVETLPTMIMGTAVNQLYQPIAGLEVSLPDVGVTAITDQQGIYQFGFEDKPDFRLPSGRQKIVFNPQSTFHKYGTIESYVNLQHGEVNRVGNSIVPVLSSQLPYEHIRSGLGNISVGGGDIQLDASQANFVFPDNNSAGNVHVQFTTAQQMSHSASSSARPLWVYAIQPQGIEVHGDLVIDLLPPKLNGSREYLPENGTYVLWVGQDSETLQVTPIGVGIVQDQHVITQGKLTLERLDYIGFAFVPDELQVLLQRYANGEVSFSELIAVYEIQARSAGE